MFNLLGGIPFFFNHPNMFRKSLLLVKHPRKSYTNPLGHMSIYVHACPGANEHEMPSLLDLPTSLGRWHPPQKRPRISQAAPPGWAISCNRKIVASTLTSFLCKTGSVSRFLGTLSIVPATAGACWCCDMLMRLLSWSLSVSFCLSLGLHVWALSSHTTHPILL